MRLPDRGSPRVCAAIAALMIFCTAAYFRNTRPGWNVNSQFALTLAIVERGTLSIDAYHDQRETMTGDKAHFNGHFYCDKSPVTPILGVPAAAAARWIMGFDSGKSGNIHTLRYWTTLGSVGLCAGALAGMLTVLLCGLGAEPRWAAAAAALWIVATPLMGYAIIFFNYLPACAFSTGGLLLLLPIMEAKAGARTTEPGWKRLFAAGLFTGLACWTLQTVALFAVILTLALMAVVPPARWLRLWPWAVGGMVGVCGYAIYSIVIFGHVTSPYRYEFKEEFRIAMAQGLMGASWPSLKVIQLITVHPFQGLFVLFPAALVAVCGALWNLRNPRHRLVSGLALGFLAGLILYNSGYYMWWGGWAYAPRHLIPALPLLVVGFLPMVVCEGGLGGRWVRYAALLVIVAGATMNIMAFSLDPQPSPGLPNEALYRPHEVEQWPRPFFNLIGYVIRGQTDDNFGVRLGLRGVWSLLPLGLAWLAALAFLLVPFRLEADNPTTLDGSRTRW